MKEKRVVFENTNCMFFGKDGKCYEPAIRHKEVKNYCKKEICPWISEKNATKTD